MVFSGTKGFIKTIKRKMPMRLYFNWLKEKWKFDLKMMFCIIVKSPTIVTYLLCVILSFITGIISEKLDCLSQAIKAADRKIFFGNIFINDEEKLVNAAIIWRNASVMIWRDKYNGKGAYVPKGKE